jgi:hypothetical protein
VSDLNDDEHELLLGGHRYGAALAYARRTDAEPAAALAAIDAHVGVAPLEFPPLVWPPELLAHLGTPPDRCRWREPVPCWAPLGVAGSGFCEAHFAELGAGAE